MTYAELFAHLKKMHKISPEKMQDEAYFIGPEMNVYRIMNAEYNGDKSLLANGPNCGIAKPYQLLLTSV